MPFIQASAVITGELLGTSLKSPAAATAAKAMESPGVGLFSKKQGMGFRYGERLELERHNNADFKRSPGLTAYRVDRHNRRSLNKLPSC